MPTSGTTNFLPDFTELAEEAYERAGKEMRSGYDLRTARRSFNLLTLEWANRGINMWTIEEGSLPLVSGTATYQLPADTIDFLEQVIRTNSGDVANQSDIAITRISAPTYATIPNKLTPGRPIQFWMNRLVAEPEVTFWPVPNTDNYTFAYWRMRRIQDAGDGVETPDVNYRFYPALVAGLAYYLAVKDPDLMPRVQMLKQQYDESFRHAAAQDREKAYARIVPKVYRI